MAYRLNRKEPVPEGIRRIAAEQVRKALDELSSTSLDRHEAIHQARKRFKKVRAVLRLARGPLGTTFEVENIRFRDMGRALSDIRDAEAMLETFQHLASTDSGLDASVLAAAQDFLGRRKEQLTAEGDSGGEQIHAVCALLAETLPRIPAWPLEGGGFSMIGSGLERVYRQGARSFHRAYETGAPADFHEWRKRVKDHWYHLRLLSDIWPGVMRGHRRSLRDLSELVGDHHNLAVLWELFAAAPELPPRLKTELDGCIHARMQALEKQAQRAGALVYAETPGALRRRLKRYWQSWRK